MMARATARVARTILNCPCYTLTYIVRATLAVALAVQMSSRSPWQSKCLRGRPGHPNVFAVALAVQSYSQQSFTDPNHLTQRLFACKTLYMIWKCSTFYKKLCSIIQLCGGLACQKGGTKCSIR